MLHVKSRKNVYCLGGDVLILKLWEFLLWSLAQFHQFSCQIVETFFSASYYFRFRFLRIVVAPYCRLERNAK